VREPPADSSLARCVRQDLANLELPNGCKHVTGLATDRCGQLALAIRFDALGPDDLLPRDVARVKRYRITWPE
jgi:hypothetical protein